MIRRVRRGLLKILRPFLIAVSKTSMPWSRKKIRAKDYRDIRQVLVPGQVILTRTLGEMSSLLIPGYWKHAGIYDGENSVIEASAKGVLRTDLIDFVMKRDHVMVVKPAFASEGWMLRAAKWACEQVGKPYDYYFDDSDDAFYCSELCVQAYIRVMGEDKVPFKLRSRVGVPTTTPDDFARATSKWHQVYLS